MSPLNWKVVTWSLGLFGAVTFVVCVVYGLIVPKALHSVQFLEMVLPGFHWLSLGAFVLGLVESFLYGAYTGLVFVPIYNTVARRVGRQDMAKDPVCGMNVDEKKAAVMVIYDGRTYYFCSAGCKATFEKASAKYAGK